MSKKPLSGSLALSYTVLCLLHFSYTDFLPVHQTPWLPVVSVAWPWGFACARLLLFVMVLPDIFAWLAQMSQLFRKVFPDDQT